MSLWTPRSVVGFAQDAGWVGDALRDAVAHAWAASGGDDAKLYGSTIPGSTVHVGLWQLPARFTGPGPTVGELTDPRHNARVAFDRWTSMGSFDWSPQVTPRVARDAAHIADLACAAGRGVTIPDGGGSAAAARPAGALATGASAGLRAGMNDYASRVAAGLTRK